MKRSADFTTNPEGIRTRDPRRAMRKDHQKGVWSNIVDVQAIVDFINQENRDMLGKALQAGVAVDEGSAERIASSRMNEAVENGNAHNLTEAALVDVKNKIDVVNRSIRDKKAFPDNPFVAKESVNNSLNALYSELEKLNTQEGKMRSALDKTHDKFPLKFKKNPHVPWVDEK